MISSIYAFVTLYKPTPVPKIKNQLKSKANPAIIAVNKKAPNIIRCSLTIKII